MNKFIGIPALSFVVITAVALTACDQGETPAKRPSGMDKTIEGTWFYRRVAQYPEGCFGATVISAFCRQAAMG